MSNTNSGIENGRFYRLEGDNIANELNIPDADRKEDIYSGQQIVDQTLSLKFESAETKAIDPTPLSVPGHQLT